MLGGVGLFVALSIMGYFTLRAKADRALQKDGLLEALRMLNAGGLDSEIVKLLDAQLPRWPISDEIKSAVGDLQSLKVGFDAAARAGVSPSLIAAFKRDTLKALDGLWHMAEHVGSAGAQESQMAVYAEQASRVREAANGARLALAQLALAEREDNLAERENAEVNLRALSVAASALNDNARAELDKTAE